jgi:tRNA (guanine37-N1)-methyltransferase
MKVPDRLVSGHHAEIARWRAEQAQLRTLQRRPELMNRVGAEADREEKKTT